MNPQIELLSWSQVDLTSLKSACKNVDIRPDYILAQYPVSLSEDAQYLLYLANLTGIPINNPKDTLSNLPYFVIKYLSYTIMIGCDKVIKEELLNNFKGELVTKEYGDIYLIIATGHLADWVDTIIINTKKKSELTLLMDKLVLFFEKRGLGDLFSKYSKKPLNNGLFLLESKR